MPIQYGVPFYPGWTQAPVTQQLAAGPRPPDFGNLDLFGGFQAGRDAAQKQALQDLFQNLQRDPTTGELPYRQMADALARTGGAPQLQNIITLENLEQQRKLPPIGYPTPPQAPTPPSIQRPGGISATEPDTGGGEPLRPGQQGNLGEVTGVSVQPARSYAEEPLKATDQRYPPQFSQTPDTGPPTRAFTQPDEAAIPPKARPQQFQPTQVAQASGIPGIPTQPQGNFGQAQLDYWQRRATVSNELARRAGMAGNAQMEQAYRNDSMQAQQNANAIQQGLIDVQKKQGETQVELGKDIYKGSREGFLAANQQQQQLDTIDKDLKTMGPDWVGAGASARAKLARTANTILNLLPNDIRASLPNEIRDGFSSEALASWESFNKASQKLGFALAKSLGSREAMQIVQAATASVPNADQTYWGARLVSAGMRQAAER